MILTLILFILILGIIVMIHESGHFLFAKLVGVHVYEFSIGMGPAIFKKQAKDKTIYAIRAIPIGGYVSLAGEEVEIDLKKQKGHNLQDKSVFQRFLVMFMGVGFNFIFAFLVLFFTGLIWGSPNLDPIISDVTLGYPASLAGISKGDKVLKINNHKITYLEDISLYLTVEDLNKPVTFEVEKQDGTNATYKFQPQKAIVNKKETFKVGVVLKSESEKGLGKAFIYGFKETAAIFKQMFVVIGNLFTGGVSINQLSGPVGIYNIVGQMEEQGVKALLYLVALLSINVGVINMLPFPAFDGGRILFLFIEKLRGKPVSAKVENTIHSIGFILLMVLMIYITFNDIIKLF